MEWLLLIDVGILLWYSYFASIVLLWFAFGMDDGKDGKNSFKELDGGQQFWLCVVCTVAAPLILLVLGLGWFYGKGKEYGEVKQKRKLLKRELVVGNEEGLDANALDRLGVNDRT